MIGINATVTLQKRVAAQPKFLTCKLVVFWGGVLLLQRLEPGLCPLAVGHHPQSDCGASRPR